MANRFEGSYRTFAERPVIRTDGRTNIHGPRGVARVYKGFKREEAEERNGRTPREYTRAFAREYGYKRNSDRIRNGLEF